ncbi:MAG: hypothetical protein WC959_00535 [Kiritimatiellales bacterium]
MGTNLDLIIIGVYLCVLVCVGIVFGRIVNTGIDYFRAGGRGCWWLVGASMFMSGISAYTFVGNAAGIYQSGWSPLAIYLANITGFLLAALFLAAWYRQMRVVTFAEVLKERFGKTSEQIVTYLLVLNGYMWSGVVLYTLAVFTKTVIPDVSVQLLIAVVGTVVVFYCTIGGNWAVMANDFVQGLVLVAVISIVTALCLLKSGGVSGFISAMNQPGVADDLTFITPVPAGETIWTAKYTLAWIVIAFVIQFANQTSLFQGVRYFSAKDGREARKASAFAGILMVLGLAVFFIPPIYARLFLPEQVLAMDTSPAKAVEYAYAVASYNVLPRGTFSIMLVAIFAAAISSLDTGLNQNAALIVRDLMPPVRKQFGFAAVSPEREVFFGKIATVISGVIIMSIALIYSYAKDVTIFDLMMQLAGRLIFPQMIPLTLFLFFRKVPRWGLLSSIAGGFLPSILEFIFGWRFSYQIMGLSVLAGGCTGFFIACVFWKNVSPEEKMAAETFYRKMRQPIDFSRETGNANDAFQLIQIGRFAALLGGLTLILLVPLKLPAARLVVLILAGFIGGIGLIMMHSGKRIARKATEIEGVNS